MVSASVSLDTRLVLSHVRKLTFRREMVCLGKILRGLWIKDLLHGEVKSESLYREVKFQSQRSML